MKALIAASLILAFAAAPVSFASAQTVHYGVTKNGTLPSQPFHRTARNAQPKIACTVAGCFQVPRNCQPEIGYTMDGTPTGYDVVACR